MARTHISAVYGLVDNHVAQIIKVFDDNILACFEANSFKDSTTVAYLRTRVLNIVTGAQIFKPIAVLLVE